MSPLQRSMKSLKDAGYLPWKTEVWNGFARKRLDLFNIADILAVKDNETLAVQCTSDSNVSARVKKIAEHENTPKLREAGWRIVVHGWRKSKGRWVLRVVDCS